MPVFNGAINDYLFILNEYLDLTEVKEKFNVDDSIIENILSEAEKFCKVELLPINMSGDSEGVKKDGDNIILPKGFVQAYHKYVELGWPSFTCDSKYQGQNLPNVLNMPIVEMICSTNLSFGMIPGLSHGAYNAIYLHGSDKLKEKYLPNIVSGVWTGVMCLTEPQCGTDLGLITTKAVPDGDSYKITGSKIFISAGDHDAAENIIHLVLAKLPDSPEGSKGISLFLVPKYKVSDNGEIGDSNNVICTSLEEKMGIHASPTCVMNYEESEGYLIGEPNKGLKAMFTMMNEARLYVGVQGLGLAEIAYQNALNYANERLQGRSITGAKYPNKKADPIIVHPDVRRMILTMRSFTEAARALALEVALDIDINGPESDFVNFITPIVKSYFTDMGSLCTNEAMQVFGGHGYIKEYGIEQFVRDARIAQIYEGANGIQALDLVGRKLPYNTGQYLKSFFEPATEFVESNKNNKDLEEFNKALHKVLRSAKDASLWIAANGLADPEQAAAAATDYLKLMSLAVFAFIWAKQVKLSIGKEGEFYASKIKTARFFMNKILPEHYSLLAKIVTGKTPLEI